MKMDWDMILDFFIAPLNKSTSTKYDDDGDGDHDDDDDDVIMIKQHKISLTQGFAYASPVKAGFVQGDTRPHTLETLIGLKHS